MKKLFLFGTVFIMLMALGSFAMADDDDDGDGWGKLCKECLAEGCVLGGPPLPTGKWTETGCTPGAQGNELYAVGKDGKGKKAKTVWEFTGAQLNTVNLAWIPSPAICYLTDYTGGTFELKVPCRKESLVADNVTAYNYTCKEDSGFLSYMIYFSGVFTTTDPDMAFTAVGHYAGIPDYDSVDCVLGDKLDSITLVLTPVITP